MSKPMFSSKSFIVSVITSRPLIHLKFTFVYDVRKFIHFIFLDVAAQFSQHHLLKRLSFLHCIFCIFCQSCPWVLRFISGLSVLFHWSIFLYLCHYHTVLMPVALQYNLKSGELAPPAPFFFFKIALGIQSLLCFHPIVKKKKNLFQFCEKCYL